MARSSKAPSAIKGEITCKPNNFSSASDDYKSAVNMFDEATKSLKKEASLLRAENLTSAVSSLTDTINSLKNLSQSITSEDGSQLADAITQAVQSAQKLRGILEDTA